MSGQIFISYRRTDSPREARALYERLRRDFGHEQVFIDLEGIAPGEDFIASLERHLAGCDVVLVLIGRDWLMARDSHGGRRLDDASDFVRIELRTALERAIRVIPVLVDGASMPAATDLPADLQELSHRQAIPLDFNRFDADVGRLAAFIRSLPHPVRAPARGAPPSSVTRRPARTLIIAACVVIGSVLLIAGWLSQRARHPTERAPLSRWRDCDSACPWLVALAPGNFMMGENPNQGGTEPNASPRHEVKIAYPLAIMEAEVTVAQFRAFIDATHYTTDNGCDGAPDGGHAQGRKLDWRDPGFTQSDDHPVVCVNWYDAQEYAKWLSRKTGHSYRLPSEAEWEYAARAGSTSVLGYGDSYDAICSVGNIRDKSAVRADSADVTRFDSRDPTRSSGEFADCSDGHAYTAATRSFAASAWGLYDMYGNAAEWVQDCIVDFNYNHAPLDGSSIQGAPCVDANYWVSRGGSWGTSPFFARAARRSYIVASVRSPRQGMRLVRVLP